MSAFQVTGTHIAAMVGTIWAKDRYQEWDQAKAEEVAAILAKENARSVAYRYPVREMAEPYSPVAVKPEEIRRFRSNPLGTVEMFKAITCFRYQACETKDWEETEAYGFCREMEARTMNMMAGYDEAPWGIEDGWHGGAQ